jgi:hypothetical protein
MFYIVRYIDQRSSDLTNLTVIATIGLVGTWINGKWTALQGQLSWLDALKLRKPALDSMRGTASNLSSTTCVSDWGRIDELLPFAYVPAAEKAAAWKHRLGLSAAHHVDRSLAAVFGIAPAAVELGKEALPTLSR